MPRTGSATSAGGPSRTAGDPPPPTPDAPPGRLARFRASLARQAARLRTLATAALVVAAAALTVRLLAEPPLTQRDIDAAVAHALETHPPAPPAARAWEAIAPSVVRVRALDKDSAANDEAEGNVGSGVVIVDDGTILTNLHVVAGAERIRVEFFDGHVSDARVIALEPAQDLAVLRAKSIPDDLKPATMASTRNLAVGAQVIAVGFPFGIGPTVTSGVVSGLRREFRSPEGKRMLTDLIQFDAAANPGNSGGPLVTVDGEVVGIVTAIMNPTEQRVFVGIGFAVPIETAAMSVGMSPF
ncbi:S1C family serine protease [Zeimonas arvi]